MTAATAAIPDAKTSADPPSSPPRTLLERLPGRIPVPPVRESAVLNERGAQHHGRVDRRAASLAGRPRWTTALAGANGRPDWPPSGRRRMQIIAGGCSVRRPPPAPPAGRPRMAATSKRMTVGGADRRSRCSRSHRAANRRILACLVGPTASAGTPKARPGAGLDLAEDQRAPEGDDQIQLAVTAAPVAVQDPVTPILIPVRRPLLPERAEGATTLARQPSPGSDYSSFSGSSSTLTSLKVTTRTEDTNRAGRYISQTQASRRAISK